MLLNTSSPSPTSGAADEGGKLMQSPKASPKSVQFGTTVGPDGDEEGDRELTEEERRAQEEAERIEKLQTDYHRAAAMEWIKDDPNFTKIKRMLQTGVDFSLLYTDTESGNSSLHRMAYHGQKELARRAVDQGADVNARNAVGRTPVHL